MVYPDFDENEYDWNETGVDYVLKDPENNADVEKQKIIFFFKCLDIKNIGPKVIGTLYNAGYNTLSKLFNMNAEKLAREELKGIAIKSATKYIDHINSAITGNGNGVNLELIMKASCVFGRYIGESKLKDILDVYPNLLELSEEDTSDLYEDFIKIFGIKEKTATKVSQNLKYFVEWLEDHPEIIIKNESDIDNNIDERFEDLVGKKVLFTGFVDEKIKDGTLKKLLEENGIIVKDNFVNDLAILIRKDDNFSSGSVTKANAAIEKKKSNVIIISLKDFLEAYDIKK